MATGSCHGTLSTDQLSAVMQAFKEGMPPFFIVKASAVNVKVGLLQYLIYIQSTMIEGGRKESGEGERENERVSECVKSTRWTMHDEMAKLQVCQYNIISCMH